MANLRESARASFAGSLLVLAVAPADIGSATIEPGQKIKGPSDAPQITQAAPKAQVEEVRLEAADPNRKCTTLRIKPNEIMFGRGCDTDSEAIPVDGAEVNRGWQYSVISVEGIYKCAYIRPGTLPKLNPRPGAMAECKKHHKPLTTQRHYYLKRINGEEILPGVELYRDGAHSAQPKKDCALPYLYANYATDEPSPSNIFGTGEGGFSQPVDDISEKGVRYRSDIELGSKDGRAAVVRGVEWGLTLGNCIREEAKDGGTISDFSQEKMQRILASPVSSAMLFEAEQKRAAWIAAHS